MTTENDFLVFSGASGANVVAQSEYAAQTWQQAGFSSGIAQSAQMNKVWRQSSIMAAVLAQFIVNQSGQPAIDDGTTTTLLTNFQEAINVLIASGITSGSNANGYWREYPDGFIEQWGAAASVPPNSGVTIELPKTFPTQTLGGVCSLENNGTASVSTPGIFFNSTSQITLYNTSSTPLTITYHVAGN